LTLNWNYRSRITMLRQSSLARLQEIVQVPFLEAHDTSMPVVRELPQPDILAYSGHTQLEVASSLFYCQPFIALHIISIALNIAICQAITLNIKNKPDLSLKDLTNGYEVIYNDTRR